MGKPIFASWPGYAGTLSHVHFARRESVDLPGHIINKESANLANLYLSTSERYIFLAFSSISSIGSIDPTLKIEWKFPWICTSGGEVEGEEGIE